MPMSAGLLESVDYWGLDPLWKTHIKLFISCVHRLPRIAHFATYALFDLHAIRFVEIAGFVVEWKEHLNSWKFTVDDGTGCINCVRWKDDIYETLSTPVALGDFVVVRGRIQSFKDRREIVFTSCRVCNSPNSESVHVLESIRLAKDIYLKPFALPNLNFLRGEMKPVESIKEGLVRWIEETQLEFFTVDDLLHELQNAPEINNLINNEEVMRGELISAIQEIDTEGLVFPLRSLPTGEVLEYGVISAPTLAPLVLTFVRDKQRCAIENGQTAILWGFKIDAILHRVKQDRRFAHVRYPLVKKAVDQLVMRSLLYYTWGDEKVLAIL